jgi:hypothetical protein
MQKSRIFRNSVSTWTNQLFCRLLNCAQLTVSPYLLQKSYCYQCLLIDATVSRKVQIWEAIGLGYVGVWFNFMKIARWCSVFCSPIIVPPAIFESYYFFKWYEHGPWALIMCSHVWFCRHACTYLNVHEYPIIILYVIYVQDEISMNDSWLLESSYHPWCVCGLPLNSICCCERRMANKV